jgi:GNAT superfamily N-acetyltransferase
MKTELTPELIDQIIFGMENQTDHILFDTETNELVSANDVSDDDDTERYVELPEWNSLKGYQLMERFVKSLRNPIVRESLREALSRGKGVFRNFKNVLRERKDIERLWFSFKEKEMKTIVLEWYQQIREMKGYEKLSFEPDDTTEIEELVLSDFRITGAIPEQIPMLQELDKEAFYDMLSGVNCDFIERMYHEQRRGKEVAMEDGSYVYVASASDEEIAGFIWGIDEPAGIVHAGEAYTGFVYSKILQLYIHKTFRGLGLSKTLLNYYLKEAFQRNIKKTFIELFGSGSILYDHLVTHGFSIFSQKLSLDMNIWYEENSSLS